MNSLTVAAVTCAGNNASMPSSLFISTGRPPTLALLRRDQPQNSSLRDSNLGEMKTDDWALAISQAKSSKLPPGGGSQYGSNPPTQSWEDGHVQKQHKVAKRKSSTWVFLLFEALYISLMCVLLLAFASVKSFGKCLNFGILSTFCPSLVNTR